MLRLGYTYGDLGGIGQEIFYKFQENFSTTQLAKQIEIKLIDEDFTVDSAKITMGKASAYAGEHAANVLQKASTLIKNGDLDYLITGPVAKESLWLAGIEYSGQTELLATINGLTKDDIEMFFVLDDLRLVLATRHIPLKDVPDELARRLPKVLENVSQFLERNFAIKKPRIAIAGLNPHAGENGLLGKEEQEIMTPIVKKFQSDKNFSAELFGPFAADYLLANAAQKYLKKEKLDYDLYMTSYHDQGLAVIKGIGGFRAINLTLGLPFLRLSVDHGTAFDIAGKGVAKPEALWACTEYALKLHTLQVKR